MAEGESAARREAGERISREIAALHEESYGTPPRSVQTHVLDDAVLCILDIDLLLHERTLLANGRGAESIHAVRTAFQRTVRSTFVAAVEHSTGRRVTGFISDTHLDPPFTIEFFRLAGAHTEPDIDPDLGTTSAT